MAGRSIEIRGIPEAMGVLDPAVAWKASVRTINDLTDKAITRASKKIQTIYNIKATPLKKRMRATKLSFSGSGKAAVITTGSVFNLFDFAKARELARGGVSVRIRKDRQPVTFRWAFVGRSVKGVKGFKTGIKEGTPRAYEREWRAERARQHSDSNLTRRAPWPRFSKKYREPIRSIPTIGAADMFDIDPVYGDIQDLVDTDWESGFKRNYAFYAERAGV